jgi:hypothetical protein
MKINSFLWEPANYLTKVWNSQEIDPPSTVFTKHNFWREFMEYFYEHPD